MKTLLKTLLVPLSMGLLSLCPATASAQVNYDTAWTFVYDGGKYSDSSGIGDDFHDVKPLPDGGCV